MRDEKPETVHRYAFDEATRKAGRYDKWAPVCGQRDANGKGWARTRYTDDPTRVTCKKCFKLMSDAVTAPKHMESAE